MQLGSIYYQVKDKGVALTRLAQWYDRVEKAGFESFNVVVRSVQAHYLTILSYFDHRRTNASVESFNAKIKAGEKDNTSKYREIACENFSIALNYGISEANEAIQEFCR